MPPCAVHEVPYSSEMIQWSCCMSVCLCLATQLCTAFSMLKVHREWDRDNWQPTCQRRWREIWIQSKGRNRDNCSTSGRSCWGRRVCNHLLSVHRQLETPLNYLLTVAFLMAISHSEYVIVSLQEAQISAEGKDEITWAHHSTSSYYTVMHT